MKVAPVFLSGAVLGLTLACAWPAYTQDGPGGQPQGPGQNQTPQPGNLQRGDERAPNLDRVLESYQSLRQRSGRNIDQTRQEIERMVKELNELTAVRYQMAVALASQRAAQQTQRMNAPAASQGASQSASSNQPGTTTSGATGEAELQMREACARELEQVQTQLRGEIESARNLADQYASQIRALREQQRDQMRGEEGGQNRPNAPQGALGSPSNVRPSQGAPNYPSDRKERD
jgi:hypothetical protein